MTEQDYQQGLAAHQRGDLDRARDCYEKALATRPDHFGSLHYLGALHYQTGRHEDALACLNRAVAVNPKQAGAWNIRGIVLGVLRQYEEALRSYRRAVELKPDMADAYSNLAVAQYEMQQYEASLASCDRALALQPNYAEARFNRGNALRQLLRFEEALQSYDEALRLTPQNAEIWNSRGVVLQELKRHEPALQSFQRAVQLKPDHAHAYNNAGMLLADLSKYPEALQAYEHAVQIDAGFAEAHANMGHAQFSLRDYAAAVAAYDNALALAPDFPRLAGMRLTSKMHLSDWRGVDQEIASLCERICAGHLVSPPWPVLALTDSLAVQKAAATVWVRERCPPRPDALPPLRQRSEQHRIRLGYFSGDFYNHAVSQLTAGLFESHDRERFEVVGFSFGSDNRDPVRQRLERAFDRFVEVRNRTDKEVALLAREMEIDIAIDLGGYTSKARTGIFSLRAAPVQVNFLGYAATMAAPYMDYLLADDMIIPAESRDGYTEQIAYLHSYQPNDFPQLNEARRITRAEQALPETAVVFCCFNTSYKILPQTFESWMRILQRVENSVLWLAGTSEVARTNLREAAQRAGVDPSRLIFAGKELRYIDHLARLSLADIFLDTLPYNAHTTGSDALRAGLPLVTCCGEAFAGRVAASLLKAVGLPELITHSIAEYEALAVALATDVQRRESVRRHLSTNGSTSLLFDTRRYTRDLERLFAAMHARQLAQLPPAHLLLNESPYMTK